MPDIKIFIKSYWEYFLELEEQLIETKRFVEFDSENDKAYSLEYLKLYQAVCSEIDVVGKEIAVALNPSFEINNNTNIQKWGYEIQQAFPKIKNILVLFNDEISIQPFENWEYEKHTKPDKNGIVRTTFAIKDGKDSIKWWSSYNKIKHRRIGLVEGTKNFQLANQKNLINAFAALFVLESLYIETFPEGAVTSRNKSRLFSLLPFVGVEV